MVNEITNPLKAIRAKCLDCCFGSPSEVSLCGAVKCPLHPFRLGKNPYRQRREMSEEERLVLADRLREARKNIGNSVEKSEVSDG